MAHGAPFLEMPNYKTIASFQIMKLRPQGCRPPPSPPPLPPLLLSSPRKAPSGPTLKKSSIWLERNDLLVNRTSWIREPWVLTFVLWRRAQLIPWIGQGSALAAVAYFPGWIFHLGWFSESFLFRCTWACFLQKSGGGVNAGERLVSDRIEFREAALCGQRGRNTFDNHQSREYEYFYCSQLFWDETSTRPCLHFINFFLKDEQFTESSYLEFQRAEAVFLQFF